MVGIHNGSEHNDDATSLTVSRCERGFAQCAQKTIGMSGRALAVMTDSGACSSGAAAIWTVPLGQLHDEEGLL